MDIAKAKLRIQKACDFIMSLAIGTYTDFRLEEIEEKRVVVSYKEEVQYFMEKRIMSEVTFDENDEPVAMKVFK